MFYISILIFWITALVGIAINSKKRYVICKTKNCSHKKGNKCKLDSVVIYDNSALGICLYHTGSMQERVLDPFQSGKNVGKTEGEIKVMKKILEVMKEDEIIKNPAEFKDWMERHGFKNG